MVLGKCSVSAVEYIIGQYLRSDQGDQAKAQLSFNHAEPLKPCVSTICCALSQAVSALCPDLPNAVN